VTNGVVLFPYDDPMTPSRTALTTLVIAQVLFLQTIASGVGAQEPPKTPPTITATPDVKNTLEDILVLKTGRKIRGMILDSDPNGSVLILNGENQKLKFAMNEVSFAGAFNKWKASQEPPASKKEESSKPSTIELLSKKNEGVRVKFVSSTPEKILTFYMKEGSVGPLVTTTSINSQGVRSVSRTPMPTVLRSETICVAPCSKTMLPGVYYLGLSIKQHKSQTSFPTIPTGDFKVEIKGPSKVTGTYTSNERTRKTGWALVGIGASTVLIGSIASVTFMTKEECSPRVFSQQPSCETQINIPAFIGSIVIGTGAIVWGMILTSKDDNMGFEVTPLTAAEWKISDKVTTAPKTSDLIPQGMMVRGRF
jgi:hypothetical protein